MLSTEHARPASCLLIGFVYKLWGWCLSGGQI